MRSSTLTSKLQKHSFHDLPMDIVEIILLVLPVISLLKFRCVSKQWCSLISSPDFSKTHLINSNRCSDFKHIRVMLSFAGKFLDHLSLPRLLSTPRIDPGVQKNLSDYYSKTARIVASCDGLICLVFNEKELVLWNPSTRKRRFLPSFGVPPKQSQCRFGFGFDNSSNDYKAVVFFTSIYSPFAKVFNFRTGRWRRIKGHYSAISMGKPTIFGNGKFYWVTECRKENSFTEFLCYLELETQVYRMFEIPECTGAIFYYSLALSEQKCIHVLRTCYMKTGADVFVFNEEDNNNVVVGNEEFWTKLCTIDYAKIDPWITPSYTNNCSLHLLNNGEILLLDKTMFMIYNPKDGSMRYSEIRSPVGLGACTYVESLAWL